jgi:hypothetical protein
MPSLTHALLQPCTHSLFHSLFHSITCHSLVTDCRSIATEDFLQALGERLGVTVEPGQVRGWRNLLFGMPWLIGVTADKGFTMDLRTLLSITHNSGVRGWGS